LLLERDVIAKFVATVEALDAEVRAQEARYGIASDDIHAAIEDGRLVETGDVCDWLMDYELLERARSVAWRPLPRGKPEGGVLGADLVVLSRMVNMVWNRALSWSYPQRSTLQSRAIRRRAHCS
jgi:hypothetical protein